MKQTAVEFLMEKLFDPSTMVQEQIQWFEQAKEMEKAISQQYAEFAIECDRKELPVLEFDGWINL
jgi:hypothetical protein